MHRLLARRSAELVVSTLLAIALGHVLFNAGLDQMSWGAALADTPGHLLDALRGELGYTPGGGCISSDQILQCASWGEGEVNTMLRERMTVDVQLVVVGMLLGTLGGIAGGRWCAAYPRTFRTRVLHTATAFLLSCPPYFLAFAVLIWFSWNTGDFKLPFVSGQGDYKPFGEDPLAFLKAMWVPWVLVALPMSAFVLRITEAGMREALDEDFVRTARAKGLSVSRVHTRHALPVVAPVIVAMTSVNVSTMLINAAAIEYGFGIPGMFRTIRGAILGRDIAVLEAIVIEGVILAVIANLLADAIHYRVDPRIRAAGAG